MLTLESFKLLNPRAGQLEQGTGGTPEITFQEVTDVLSRCTRQCSMYSRYNYALDDSYLNKLVELITDEMMVNDKKRKRALFSQRKHWQGIARMTLVSHRASKWLTRQQKKFVADVNRWTRRHEEAYKNVASLLDEWDYELRYELRSWNQSEYEKGSR